MSARTTVLNAALAAALLSNAGAALAQTGRLITVDSFTQELASLDPATGARTAIGTITAAADSPAGLALDCATGTLYLSSSSQDALYTLDLATGVPTLVGPYGDPSVVMHGLEWDPTGNSGAGTLYGGSGGKLYTISTTTGTATLVGLTGLGTSFVNLGYDPASGTMYGTYATTDSLYTIDRATGAATLVGPLLGPTNPHGLAFNHDNGTMYLVDSSTDRLYTVNLTTGAATEVGPVGSGNWLGLVYLSDTPGCPGENECPADHNGEGGLTVQDIFDFLGDYFAGDPAADFNGEGGVTVQDIFDFLSAYFAGC
jgi:DNA-binding beta-propeller fold protein YncE